MEHESDFYYLIIPYFPVSGPSLFQDDGQVVWGLFAAGKPVIM